MQASEASQPLTFTQAALFQWVNPKAWMMFLTAIATYADPEAFVASTLVIALLFAVLGFPLISAWNLGGVSLKSFLAQEGRLLAFNRIMATVLLISLYPLLS